MGLRRKDYVEIAHRRIYLVYDIWISRATSWKLPPAWRHSDAEEEIIGMSDMNANKINGDMGWGKWNKAQAKVTTTQSSFLDDKEDRW